MKYNLYREVPLCLSKQSVWTHKLRKVYYFKTEIVIRKKLLDLTAFVYSGETCPSWHIISPTSRKVTSWGMKQSTLTWIATWLRAWAVLFSLSGSVMGRETVYLCYDFSPGDPPKLMRKECKRIQKEVPFNRRARAQKKNPRCQPPDFCYQLCTPKGVHNEGCWAFTTAPWSTRTM